MPKRRANISEVPKRRLPPTLTPEAEENQLIALATEAAKQQLLDGTASAQVITHFLKLGSRREKLEQSMMEEKAAYLAAKTEAIKATKRMEELYADALAAMKRYSGENDYDDYDDSDL